MWTGDDDVELCNWRFIHFVVQLFVKRRSGAVQSLTLIIYNLNQRISYKNTM